jgi:hypothetical protein
MVLGLIAQEGKVGLASIDTSVTSMTALSAEATARSAAVVPARSMLACVGRIGLGSI